MPVAVTDLFSPRGSAMPYVQRLMRPVLLFTNVSCARCSALPCVQCAHPRTQHQPTPGRLSETQLGAKSRHQCVSIIRPVTRLVTPFALSRLFIYFNCLPCLENWTHFCKLNLWCKNCVFLHLALVRIIFCSYEACCTFWFALCRDAHVKRKPLPKFVYNLMADKELRKRLVTSKLPTTGDRQVCG